ncbi:MAG: L-threonylcarbamoyladenylate synthase [Pseudomonadota bacterium]
MSATSVPPTEVSLGRAVSHLRDGELVGIPTETVYGLAADATNPTAVAKIYEVKARPRFNPLIAHVSDLSMAQQEGILSDRAVNLAETLWPGPLTLVVDLATTATTCDLARAGLSTIALRCPAHPVARDLIEQFGGPLVAPSANLSGGVSPTRAEHVFNDLSDKIDLILDGGPSRIGLESTIIDARGEHPALLRSGTITPDAIEQVWPDLIRPETDPTAPTAPGQLLRHYAPRARLRLNAETTEPTEALLGFGSVSHATLNLSRTGNLAEAAANLFTMLRQLDETHSLIAVSPIPDRGLGEAINDRLTRAARG